MISNGQNFYKIDDSLGNSFAIDHSF